MSRLNPNGFLNGGGDYRDFIFYKKTKVLYDMTYWYQNHYLVKGDRTKDQMEQAARSGKQNIAEGHADGMTSLEMDLNWSTPRVVVLLNSGKIMKINYA